MDNYPPHPCFVSWFLAITWPCCKVLRYSNWVMQCWPFHVTGARLQQSWSGATGRIMPWNHMKPSFSATLSKASQHRQFPEVYVWTVIMNFLIVQKYHACMVLLLYYYVLTILFPLNMAAPWFPSLCVLFVQSHCSQKFGVCNLLHLGWLPPTIIYW